jgi:hypothetical protein
MLKHFFLAVPLLAGLLHSAAQIKLPAPSPLQTIKQEFGIGSIELVYSRPSAKNRKVLGDLVPTGKLWRTGANAATRISFSHPVEIGGKKIDSGTYALYTIPAEDNWEIILNRGIKNWGTYGYKEGEDVIRFKAEVFKSKTILETFTIQFASIASASCTMQLMWDNRVVNIPILMDIKDKLKASVEAALLSEKKPHWQAAQFYYEYEHNLPRALEQVNKAIETNQKAFWIHHYKARIQKDMGDTAGAITSATTSLQLAKDAANDDYIRMNQQMLKDLKKL